MSRGDLPDNLKLSKGGLVKKISLIFAALSFLVAIYTANADVYEEEGNVFYVKEGKSYQLTHSGLDFSPILSPDGTRVYFTRKEIETSGNVYAADIGGGNERFITDGILLKILNSGNLAVEKHKYFLLGGSYDWVWSVSSEGEEIGPIVASREDFFKWEGEYEFEML
jgi:hypothetical protein